MILLSIYYFIDKYISYCFIHCSSFDFSPFCHCRAEWFVVNSVFRNRLATQPRLFFFHLGCEFSVLYCFSHCYYVSHWTNFNSILYCHIELSYWIVTILFYTVWFMHYAYKSNSLCYKYVFFSSLYISSSQISFYHYLITISKKKHFKLYIFFMY